MVSPQHEVQCLFWYEETGSAGGVQRMFRHEYPVQLIKRCGIWHNSYSKLAGL
jgi:hypothetical protein